MIAYDYPLAGIFWTMLLFFLWLAWFSALFGVIGDVFHSDDLGGAAKAGWTAAVIIVPFLGLMIYLLFRGEGMQGRRWAVAQERQAGFEAQVRSAAPSSGAADELNKLIELRSNGVITPDEFERQKAKVLS
jgi:hypothetical protein